MVPLSFWYPTVRIPVGCFWKLLVGIVPAVDDGQRGLDVVLGADDVEVPGHPDLDPARGQHVHEVSTVGRPDLVALAPPDVRVHRYTLARWSHWVHLENSLRPR